MKPETKNQHYVQAAWVNLWRQTSKPNAPLPVYDVAKQRWRNKHKSGQSIMFLEEWQDQALEDESGSLENDAIKCVTKLQGFQGVLPPYENRLLKRWLALHISRELFTIERYAHSRKGGEAVRAFAPIDFDKLNALSTVEIIQAPQGLILADRPVCKFSPVKVNEFESAIAPLGPYCLALLAPKGFTSQVLQFTESSIAELANKMFAWSSERIWVAPRKDECFGKALLDVRNDVDYTELQEFVRVPKN
jgi:hypothetical protein